MAHSSIMDLYSFAIAPAAKIVGATGRYSSSAADQPGARANHVGSTRLVRGFGWKWCLALERDIVDPLLLERSMSPPESGAAAERPRQARRR